MYLRRWSWKILVPLSVPLCRATCWARRTLSLYLYAEPLVIGASLIQEQDRHHKPIYYVIQVLKDVETRYLNLEKFAFTMVTFSKKLRHYFQGWKIKVIIDQPLRRIIHKPDVSGRLVNWAVVIIHFHLTFVPRTATKAQVLTNFLVECFFPDPQPTSMIVDS